MQTQQTIGITAYLNTDFESAIAQVTEALKVEGFGVLTEIDVRATMKKKLDVEFRPYTILGACNPTLAHRALTIAPEIGLLLPCNVTVSQMEDGQIQIAVVDPMAMLGVVSDQRLEAVAAEARESLSRVVAALGG
jgi:uncharacterized protein (DUF302 family)